MRRRAASSSSWTRTKSEIFKNKRELRFSRTRENWDFQEQERTEIFKNKAWDLSAPTIADIDQKETIGLWPTALHAELEMDKCHTYDVVNTVVLQYFAWKAVSWASE